MKADSVHGTLGKAWKKTEEILTFQDLSAFMKKASSLIEVLQMQVEDFRHFEDHCRKRQKNSDLPLLSDIKLAEFRKGHSNLFYKKSFLEDYNEINILKKKLTLKDLFRIIACCLVV